jgi:hypothetical protein
MRWKPSGPEPAGIQNPCYRGFLHYLLKALPTVTERSSDDSLNATFFFLLFLFCPFPIGYGTQINECCIQSKNDLIMQCTLSSSENRNKCSSPSHRGHNRSMDHNPSSPRLPGSGRGCLTVSWRLVSYEVYTKIGRHALLWELWVDFP